VKALCAKFYINARISGCCKPVFFICHTMAKARTNDHVMRNMCDGGKECC
jgi:hypothetical protein